MNELVVQIAECLGESRPGIVALIERAVECLGETQALALLEETQQIEMAGGILTQDGVRRRSKGGVFFRLIRNQTSPTTQYSIFNRRRRNKPVPLLNIPQDIQFLARLSQKTRGTVQFMKITLVGRPGHIAEKGGLVVISMESKPPAITLPKGLPPFPPDPTNFIIYISKKQWRRVEEAINNDPADNLIIEGYPLLSGTVEPNAIKVYTQSCTTSALKRKKKRGTDVPES